MNGKSSSTKDMPGGGPISTILGLFIIIIVFNLAGNPSSSSSIGEVMTAPASQRKEIRKYKYVDDLTIAKLIELESKLIKADEYELTRPLEFQQRTEHFMPIENNEMQKEICELEAYCEKHKMKINSKKPGQCYSIQNED